MNILRLFPFLRRNQKPPLFIFAATWRTGSTLFQRILNASGDVFIWGEPTFIADAGHLYKKIDSYFKKVAFNRQEAQVKQVGAWIPVVSPSQKRVKHGFKSLFEALYAYDKLFCNGLRWGFKEVRDNAINNIIFINTLYPDAKFFFLVRNPWDTYRSLLGKKFIKNFDHPMQPIATWNSNAADAIEFSKTNKNFMIVRFEDLVRQNKNNNSLLVEIAAHADIPLQDKMYLELNTITDSSGGGITLSQVDIDAIQQVAGNTAKRFGYIPV